MAKGPSDCLPFGGGAGGKLFGYSWMQERKLAKWSEMVEKGLKPVFVMMKPQEHWHLMRTLASSVESGPFNLKEIGDNFSVDIEKPLKPVMDQWIKAGLLEKSGEVYSPTVAGQFWYVTMAQLATEALTMAIAKEILSKRIRLRKAYIHPTKPKRG